MTEETGTVVAVKGTLARVRVQRQQKCTGCHGCLLGSGASYLDVEAENRTGARIGDRVEVVAWKGSATRSGLLLYMLPLALFIVGFIAASAVARSLGGSAGSDTPGMIGGFSFFFLTFLFIYLIGRARKRRGRSIMRVSRILERAHGTSPGRAAWVAPPEPAATIPSGSPQSSGGVRGGQPGSAQA